MLKEKGVFIVPLSLRVNKLYKHEVISKRSKVQKNAPESVIFTKKSLDQMLGKYKELIIKPRYGSQGRGIRKITVQDNGTFHVQYMTKTEVIKNKEELYRFIKNAELKRYQGFIVQKYISIAKIDGRPFDIRYIVQRKKGDVDWQIIGKYAKLAGEGYFITNLAHGAKVLTVEDALQQINIEKVQNTLNEMDQIVLLATKQLSKHIKSHFIWGFDIAIDNNGEIWIIEANSKPGIKGFQLLGDLETYKKIKSIKLYNRRRPL